MSSNGDTNNTGSSDWMSKYLTASATPYSQSGPPNPDGSSISGPPVITPAFNMQDNVFAIPPSPVNSSSQESHSSGEGGRVNSGETHWTFVSSPLAPTSTLGIRAERDEDSIDAICPPQPEIYRKMPGQHARAFASQHAAAQGLTAEQTQAVLDFCEVSLIAKGH